MPKPKPPVKPGKKPNPFGGKAPKKAPAGKKPAQGTGDYNE